MNSIEDAVTLLANALGVSRSEIGRHTRLADTPHRDSLAHMRLILALEEKLNHRLDAGQIVSITSLEDVVAVLEQAFQ